MVGSRKLSNDEVEALLGGLEGEEEQTTAAQFDPNEVREFTFGSEDLSLKGEVFRTKSEFPYFVWIKLSRRSLLFFTL